MDFLTAKKTYEIGKIVTSASGNLRTKFRITSGLKFGETNKSNLYCSSGSEGTILIYDSETNMWAKVY